MTIGRQEQIEKLCRPLIMDDRSDKDLREREVYLILTRILRRKIQQTKDEISAFARMSASLEKYIDSFK